MSERFQQTGTFLHYTKRTWLSVVLVILAHLPVRAFADDFASTHRKEIQEMVAASMKMETKLNEIQNEFARKAASDPHSSSTRTEGSLNHECYGFIHAKFYAKYRTLIDAIDTSSIVSPAFLRKNKSDSSVLRDPKKIAYEAKYSIEALAYLKDFHPPVEEFAVQYAARPDLGAKCAHYLDATGISG